MDHCCTALFFLNELTALGSWGYSRETVWSAYGLSRAHRYHPELNCTHEQKSLTSEDDFPRMAPSLLEDMNRVGSSFRSE